MGSEWSACAHVAGALLLEGLCLSSGGGEEVEAARNESTQSVPPLLSLLLCCCVCSRCGVSRECDEGMRMTSALTSAVERARDTAILLMGSPAPPSEALGSDRMD